MLVEVWTLLFLHFLQDICIDASSSLQVNLLLLTIVLHWKVLFIRETVLTQPFLDFLEIRAEWVDLFLSDTHKLLSDALQIATIPRL